MYIYICMYICLLDHLKKVYNYLFLDNIIMFLL